MDENEISKRIIACAIEVHRTLGGPGLLESVYEEALAWELSHNALLVRRQHTVPILYQGVTLAHYLVVALLVEDKTVFTAWLMVFTHLSFMRPQPLTTRFLIKTALGAFAPWRLGVSTCACMIAITV